MTLVKREKPAPPVWQNYRPTVGVREELVAEGAKLVIPSPERTSNAA